jgi:hypothetical protein
MAVKFIDLNDSYKIKTTTKDIIIDVTIGDGQVGAYSVFLGKKFINANAPADLGKKADVKGKPTIISVTIVDILEETNWTSMTVFVTEGGSETTYGPYKGLAENHLDTVIYTLKLINE